MENWEVRLNKIFEDNMIGYTSQIGGAEEVQIKELIKQELDKAREEVFTKEELECILKWRDACDGEFNGMTLLPASGEDWGEDKDVQSVEDKLEKMLSKLKDK